jgi:hypothetical protein
VRELEGLLTATRAREHKGEVTSADGAQRVGLLQVCA